jgi:hypothetical protein
MSEYLLTLALQRTAAYQDLTLIRKSIKDARCPSWHTPTFEGNKKMFRRRQKQSSPTPPLQLQSPASGTRLLWQLVGALLGITAITLSVLYWELLWEVLSEGVILTLEAGEEALDTLYEAIGLNPALSQIATAYTGFVLGLVLLYFIARKIIHLTKILQRLSARSLHSYRTTYKKWHAQKRDEILIWWTSLDWMQKTAAVTALLLIGIPLALLASFILGELVTMFFI